MNRCAIDHDSTRAKGQIDACLLGNRRGIVERGVVQHFERSGGDGVSCKGSRGPDARRLRKKACPWPERHDRTTRSSACGQRQAIDQRRELGKIVCLDCGYRLAIGDLVEDRQAHRNASATSAECSGNAGIEPQRGICHRAGEVRCVEPIRHDRDETRAVS